MVTPSGATARLRTILVYVVLPALVLVVAWREVTQTRYGSHFGVIIGDGDLKIHDFASHLTFAKTFWHGEGGYSVKDHLRAATRLAGRPLPFALPFGYSPTMLWILGPLSLLPTGLGYFVWTLLGLAGALWICRRYRSIAVAVAFVSPVAIACWSLGQTAVLTAVAFLGLMHWDATSDRARASRRDFLLVVAVVWMLTAKPPLAIAAAAALLAGRRGTIVAAALVLGVVSTAALLPLFGKAGLLEYFRLLGHYDLGTADEVFAWSLRPDSMGNLRALLHVTFGVGDAVASRWSALFWLLTSASIIVAAARREIPAELRWSLAVLAYLLFCPHVSGTEELHVVVIVAALGAAASAPASIRTAGIALALVLLFLLPLIPFGGARVLVAFSGTLLLAALLIASAWRGPASTATRTAQPSTP